MEYEERYEERMVECRNKKGNQKLRDSMKKGIWNQKL